MKLMSFKLEDAEKYGVVDNSGQKVWDVLALAKAADKEFPATILAGIESDNQFYKNVRELVEWGEQNGKDEYLHSLENITWMAPIPRPSKNIMCVGKNYRDHAIEMGSEADIPEHIIVFTKAPTTVTGHEGPVEAHADITNELDYEGELALIIGKKGRDIPEQEALDYVFGYTIINDVTARDLQKNHKQFFIGKSLDTSCPMGPWIVHHSEIDNPNALAIQTKVNGEVRQDSNTKHFIFPTEVIISTLSQGMTLEPGDIIATGTPAGVGKGFKPPRLLKSGDQIEITIEGIGKLHNTVN
ncbi:fumarylacetoacetate hydrolase family protein [Siminovitchia terrae]|uniref:fumarylacetoacetate hydrolase family protein n=1 Tax=Siminovitchia terrae TaxID=1914933 RepID=UPI001BB32E8A|nr:fumarylacetoacetate hydrolase family protein [Siminovitchia terrae]